MKTSIKKGFSFGLTSAIITTLGLIVGLNAGTHSKMIVMGGILIIAIADSLSDSLGVHISEESENQHSKKEVWESTFSSLFTKLIFALSFLIPIILLPLNIAIIVSVIWGLSIIVLISYFIAKGGKTKSWKAILEHLGIAILVIIATYFVGNLVDKYFN